MKANAQQVRAAVDRPRADVRLILLHGPDAGVAADLAARFARAVAGAERVDLDGAQLRSDPARLADEAASMSLFGDRRWIRVTNATEEALAAVQALLDLPRADPALVLAPGVKAGGKLVRLGNDHPRAVAHACYPPTPADLERLAAGLARDAGLRCAPPVAARLAAAGGGDLSVLAREVEKLALYLDADADRPADLDMAALDAVGADLGEAEAGELVDAVVAGAPDRVAEEVARLRGAGTSPIPWLRQLQRRLLALAAMRAEVDRGEAADKVMERHRVFFREKEATARALRAWPPALLARALARVREAERAVVAPGNAGTVLAESAVEAIARAQARRG